MMVYDLKLKLTENQSGFSYFKFKVRLIRPGHSFQNKNSCIWTHNLLILSQDS